MFGQAGGVYYEICYPVIERPPVCQKILNLLVCIETGKAWSFLLCLRIVVDSLVQGVRIGIQEDDNAVFPESPYVFLPKDYATAGCDDPIVGTAYLCDRLRLNVPEQRLAAFAKKVFDGLSLFLFQVFIGVNELLVKPLGKEFTNGSFTRAAKAN